MQETYCDSFVVYKLTIVGIGDAVHLSEYEALQGIQGIFGLNRIQRGLPLSFESSDVLFVPLYHFSMDSDSAGVVAELTSADRADMLNTRLSCAMACASFRPSGFAT